MLLRSFEAQPEFWFVGKERTWGEGEMKESRPMRERDDFIKGGEKRGANGRGVDDLLAMVFGPMGEELTTYWPRKWTNEKKGGKRGKRGKKGVKEKGREELREKKKGG